MPAEEQGRLKTLAPSLDAHVFVATSGSTGALKLVALSKSAILASAAAVNARLEVAGRDVWCRVLPLFHVGGLGIEARAHLAHARVIAMEWDARAFAAQPDITLASLVPAQVHDLVAAGLAAPRQLRAVLVGAGALEGALDKRARALGWPLLWSYGMSECASTIAISEELLPHLEAHVEGDGRLAFRGSSLLTGYATEEGLIDPKVDGWFFSEDLGEVDGRTLHVYGRTGDFIKIGGESVDLWRLDRIIDEIARAHHADGAVVAVRDERLGFVIHLAVTDEVIAAEFDARVMPFERARRVHIVELIPRSPLGKVLRAQLASELG
jgi:O-succinylbenzoic acid--CoA ligase